MKIIILGSGPDRIGKTGELDRFAVQALHFLRKEGHELVLVDQMRRLRGSLISTYFFLTGRKN